jgi:hypothetical protein
LKPLDIMEFRGETGEGRGEGERRDREGEKEGGGRKKGNLLHSLALARPLPLRLPTSPLPSLPLFLPPAQLAINVRVLDICIKCRKLAHV